MISRRRLLTTSALIPFVLRGGAQKIPIGLEMYSVRDEFMKDAAGTITAVAKMGYEAVEFYAPYFEWTTSKATQIRKQLEDLGLRCYSTHNGDEAFTPEGLKKAIELNRILGSRYVVMAGSGPVAGLAGWKALAERITRVTEKLTPVGMSAGFHNSESQWELVEGKRPMDVLAANTPKEFMLQFDAGSCVAARQDPVAWIKANPGRIKSIHCKDWAHWPWGGYRVLFGEGSVPWADIFQAAESVGGVEYYLIDQDGSYYPPLEAARRCLATWKRMRG
jgi:sugar phosphate isomerase/epimerase